MNTVDPVKSREEVAVVEELLKKHNGQIYADIWRMGVNLSLQITELLSITYLDFTTKNTKVQEIINRRHTENPHDLYIFQVKSNRTSNKVKPISRTSVSRAIKDVGDRLGININTGSMKKTREWLMQVDGIPMRNPRLKINSDVATILNKIQPGEILSYGTLMTISHDLETVRHVIQWIIEEKSASIEIISYGIIFDSLEKLDILNCIVDFQQETRKFYQREGIRKAVAEGRYKGRRSQFSEEDIRNIKEQFNMPHANKSAIARQHGITRQYLYKLVK